MIVEIYNLLYNQNIYIQLIFYCSIQLDLVIQNLTIVYHNEWKLLIDYLNRVTKQHQLN